MVCLDSDVLINFLRNDAKAINLIENLKKQRKSPSTTSVNCFELLKGIPKLSKMGQDKVADFLTNFNILSFNFDSSKIAAEIFDDLKSRGEMIDLADVLIASIAISNKEPLITGNLKHFKRMKELEMEDYSD